MTPDGRYSDLATIRISYTVLGPGTAAISGNIGGAALDVSAEVTAEEPTQSDQPENPTEPEKPGAGGKPSAGGTDPSASGGSQSNGQTGQQGRIAGEPGGAGVLYLKKERDE